MRLVIDTNVLIAAFISHGVCSEFLEHGALNHDVVLSGSILDELKEKFVGRFTYTTLFYYERGFLTIRNGKVSGQELVSEAEASARRESRAQAEAAARERSRRLEDRRHARPRNSKSRTSRTGRRCAIRWS